MERFSVRSKRRACRAAMVSCFEMAGADMKFVSFVVLDQSGVVTNARTIYSRRHSYLCKVLVAVKTCASVGMFLTLLVGTVGCGVSDPSVMAVRGAAMGTTYSIKWVEVPQLDRATLRKKISAELESIDLLFNRYREDSVVSRFNRAESTEPIEVGAVFCELLRDAVRVAAATDGAFDPTVLPLHALYPFGRTDGAMPADDAISAALDSVGFDKLEIGRTTLRKSSPGLMIDPNAFAKGFGVDEVAAALQRLGCSSFMVEIGGEVRCAGRKPDGAAWRIAVEVPNASGIGPDEVVALRDESIASSGDYRNFIESGGRRVHHILDPRTGRNTETRVISVSVRSDSCAWADAVATALMVTGPSGIESIRAAAPERSIAVLMFVAAEDGSVERVESNW